MLQKREQAPKCGNNEEEDTLSPVEALRRADHPAKESYRLSLIKKLRKLSPLLQKREQAPKCGSNEEEEEDTLSPICDDSSL
jgi:hypothetical protein